MKISLAIEALREGYSMNQVGKTMTTGELIEFLQDYPEDTPIYISNDNCYTYGPIRESLIIEKEEDEDEE